MEIGLIIFVLAFVAVACYLAYSDIQVIIQNWKKTLVGL